MTAYFFKISYGLTDLLKHSVGHCYPAEISTMRKMFSAPSSMVATRYMWLSSTGSVTGATDELHFQF